MSCQDNITLDVTSNHLELGTMEDGMDEDGDESDEDNLALQMGANTKSNQQKKPETEEEKRRNFLERNRQGGRF